MIAKFVQAMTCLAFLALAAPGASAQFNADAERPKVDQTKNDEVIKLYQDATKYYEAGNFKLSEATLNKFLDKQGKFAGAYFLMGMVQIQLQDFNKARVAFKSAIKYDDKMASAHSYLGALEAGLGNPKGAQDQRDILVKMKTDCAGTCRNAADIDTGIQRIDENVAAASQPQKPS